MSHVPDRSLRKRRLFPSGVQASSSSSAGCPATTTSFRPSMVIRKMSPWGGLPSRTKLNATNRPSGEKLALFNMYQAEAILLRTRTEPSAVEISVSSFALLSTLAKRKDGACVRRPVQGLDVRVFYCKA